MQDRKDGTTAGLCRGRYPFAVSELRGGSAYPCVRGQVEFYSTPAGVVISASFTGLPGKAGSHRKGATYQFCLEGGVVRKNDRAYSMIPPLYEKEGNARFSVVTGKLLPMDLMRKRISIRAYDSANDGEKACEIASGEVLCPPYWNGKIHAV